MKRGEGSSKPQYIRKRQRLQKNIPHGKKVNKVRRESQNGKGEMEIKTKSMKKKSKDFVKRRQRISKKSPKIKEDGDGRETTEKTG